MSDVQGQPAGIDPAALDEMRLAYRSHADVQTLLREIDRLRARETYLTTIFKGVASLSRCERHSGLPTTPEQYERIVAPWCRDCLAEDYRALVAGNVEATTMAARYRACSERNLSLIVENQRLTDAVDGRRQAIEA